MEAKDTTGSSGIFGGGKYDSGVCKMLLDRHIGDAGNGGMQVDHMQVEKISSA